MLAGRDDNKRGANGPDAIPTADALRRACDLGGAGSGPVVFTNGSPASGLTYTFTSLASTTDSIAFSNDGGATYTYTPVADANGYDSNVTHFRISPTGTSAKPRCLSAVTTRSRFQAR